MKRFCLSKRGMLTVLACAAFLMVLIGGLDVAESCTYAVAGSCYPYICTFPDDECIFHDSIQLAVDDTNAMSGVIVCPGTYIENVVITGRSIDIFSESGPSDTIVVAADPNKPVFYLNQSDIQDEGIHGLSIKGAKGSCTNYPGGGDCAGILLYNTDGGLDFIGDIYNNNIMDNAYGIKVVDSYDLDISDNSIIDNAIGIGLVNSSISMMYDEDDFNDGDDNGWTPMSGSWAVENSEYSGTSSSSSDPAFSIASYYNRGWDLTLVEVKANDLGTGGWQNFFIVFAYDDSAGKAYWAGARVSTNKWTIEEIDLDTGSMIELAAVYETIDSNTWYDLKVVGRGNTVTVYADDVEKVSYTFPGSMPFGNVGLGGYNNHAHFDDFRITFYPDISDISNNSIINNAIGIELVNSSSFMIYHNNIIGNTIQADDNNAANNYWHHPTSVEGNYWSDYTGSDDGSNGRTAGDGIGDTDIPHPGPDYDNYPFLLSSNWSCPDLPVMNVDTSLYYDTLQAAYNGANDGETIWFRAGLYVGDINIDRNISVTFEGGYDCYFTGIIGNTRLYGDMTISEGTLTIGNFILED